MEIRKRFSGRMIFVSLYVAFLVFYLIVGLRPAEASASYEISASLSIPSISLTTDVATLQLENHELKTPAQIAGSFTRSENKVLLIGHATTVFKDLNQIEIGAKIFYEQNEYEVKTVKILAKAEVKMEEILASEKEPTLILMSCAGELYDNGDASHRIIVEAVKN